MKSTRRSALVAFAVALAGQCAAAPVEVIPESLRGAMQPQAALSSNGNLHVAFGRSGSVYCATSVDGGRSFHAPVSVGTLPKLALGMRRGPRIVASGDTIAISAISHSDGNLIAWVSGDGGATWTPPTRINSATNSAREGMHAMAGDGRGAVYAAWLDLRSGKTQLYGATSADGGRTWGANVRIYQSPDGHICECCHPSLTVDQKGQVWAMWRNWLDGSRDMYASMSEDSGRTFSAARKLGSGTWELKGCPMDGGQIAVAPNGQLRSVWRRDQAIFASDGSGETMLSAQGLHPAVGFDGESPLYVWQSGKKLMLRKGAAKPVVLADGGAFAAIASGRFNSKPFIVWEASTNGAKTIMARQSD
jgi:hypothetical protein